MLVPPTSSRHAGMLECYHQVHLGGSDWMRNRRMVGEHLRAKQGQSLEETIAQRAQSRELVRDSRSLVLAPSHVLMLMQQMQWHQAHMVPQTWRMIP